MVSLLWLNLEYIFIQMQNNNHASLLPTNTGILETNCFIIFVLIQEKWRSKLNIFEMLLCVQNCKSPTKAMRLIFTTTTLARYYYYSHSAGAKHDIYSSKLDHPSSKRQSLNLNPELPLKLSQPVSNIYPHFLHQHYSPNSAVLLMYYPRTNWMGNLGRNEFICRFLPQDNQEKTIWRVVKHKIFNTVLKLENN